MSGNTDARPRSGGRHHNTTGGAEYSGGLPAACLLLLLRLQPAACILACLRLLLASLLACYAGCLLVDLLLPRLHLCCYLLAAFIVASRVVRVNPNPNPKCRVPEMSGFVYFEQISG